MQRQRQASCSRTFKEADGRVRFQEVATSTPPSDIGREAARQNKPFMCSRFCEVTPDVTPPACLQEEAGSDRKATFQNFSVSMSEQITPATAFRRRWSLFSVLREVIE